MKNILLFGCGRQWKKYIKYFYERWACIHTVSENNERILPWVSNHFLYLNILLKDASFFNWYDLIVVSVAPYKNQDDVITLLLRLHIKKRIIIEKPVSYNIELLHSLNSLENIYYYIDELLIADSISRVCTSDVPNIILKLPSKNKEYFSHIMEHALAGLLLRSDFSEILNNITIYFEKEESYDDGLEYSIYIDYKYHLYCHLWVISINTKILCCLDFSQCLDSLLNMGVDKVSVYKKNFTNLRQYINNM